MFINQAYLLTQSTKTAKRTERTVLTQALLPKPEGYAVLHTQLSYSSFLKIQWLLDTVYNMVINKELL